MVLLANVTISGGGIQYTNPPVGPTPTFQGSISGYSSGGFFGPIRSRINKFPFPSDSNATTVGDLTQGRYYLAGQSSSVSGYATGGDNSYLAPAVGLTTMDKFPFASDTNATFVGSLSQGRNLCTGQSSQTYGYGYTSGGNDPPLSPALVNTIDKFPFSSNSNATDVGDLSTTNAGPAGQSSNISGYTSGGNRAGTTSSVVDKFPFATNNNATFVGNLTQARTNFPTGQSSADNGYTSGGYVSSPQIRSNVIDKFSFASDSNATSVGNLLTTRSGASGQSSTVSGYTSGGLVLPVTNNISKFPFASDSNATSVGVLTESIQAMCGQQV